MYNSFKERLRETLFLEQARSLQKDSAVAEFIKQTSELNVYMDSESGFVPPETDDQADEVGEDDLMSPGVSSVRKRKESKITHA